MKLREGFITHDIEDTQIMVATGDAAGLFCGIARANETAAFIVNCLKSETTREQIIVNMLSVYDVTEEQVSKDVDMVLTKLNSIGALEM